jgi:hypothetical protein
MRLFIAGISGLLGLNVALLARERVEVAGSFFSHPVSADGLDVYAADARDPDAMTRVLERPAPTSSSTRSGFRTSMGVRMTPSTRIR